MFLSYQLFWALDCERICVKRAYALDLQITDLYMCKSHGHLSKKVGWKIEYFSNIIYCICIFYNSWCKLWNNADLVDLLTISMLTWNKLIAKGLFGDLKTLQWFLYNHEIILTGNTHLASQPVAIKQGGKHKQMLKLPFQRGFNPSR